MDKAIYIAIAITGSIAMFAFASDPAQLNTAKDGGDFTAQEAAALAISAQGLSFEPAPVQN